MLNVKPILYDRLLSTNSTVFPTLYNLNSHSYLYKIGGLTILPFIVVEIKSSSLSICSRFKNISTGPSFEN